MPIRRVYWCVAAAVLWFGLACFGLACNGGEEIEPGADAAGTSCYKPSPDGEETCCVPETIAPAGRSGCPRSYVAESECDRVDQTCELADAGPPNDASDPEMCYEPWITGSNPCCWAGSGEVPDGDSCSGDRIPRSQCGYVADVCERADTGPPEDATTACYKPWADVPEPCCLLGTAEAADGGTCPDGKVPESRCSRFDAVCEGPDARTVEDAGDTAPLDGDEGTADGSTDGDGGSLDSDGSSN